MTEATVTQALLPVTQADRDAAASINPQYFNTSTARAANMAETAAIKNGSLDHHENVQAFARHRTAHSLPGDVGMLNLGWVPSEAADEIAALRARVAELEAENDRLTKAVGSGILGELLNDEETDEFVNFIKFLRGQTKEADCGKV